MKQTLVSTAIALLMAGSAANAGTLDYLRDFNPRNDFDKRNFYLGIQASSGNLDGVEGDAGSDISSLNGTVGFFFKYGISLEGRFGIGSDQPSSLFQDPVSSFTTGMLRYHYTWNNNVMAYASVGAGIRVLGSSVDAGATAGPALALGVNLFGTKKTALNFEYLYVGGSNAQSSTGIGFHHYFGSR